MRDYEDTYAYNDVVLAVIAVVNQLHPHCYSVHRAVRLASSPGVLRSLRSQLERQRVSCSLFDTVAWTANFTRQMRALFDACATQPSGAVPPGHRRCESMHIVSSSA